jgi:hypothetical protein
MWAPNADVTNRHLGGAAVERTLLTGGFYVLSKPPQTNALIVVVLR